MQLTQLLFLTRAREKEERKFHSAEKSLNRIVAYPFVTKNITERPITRSNSRERASYSLGLSRHVLVCSRPA